MAFFLPRAWRQQPRGAVEIDRSRALGQRARGVWVPDVPTTGHQALLPTPVGIGAASTVDGAFRLPRDPAFQNASAVSVFIYGFLRASQGSGPRVFGTRVDTNSATRRGWEVGLRAGSLFNASVQFVDNAGNRTGILENQIGTGAGADWVGKPFGIVYDISRDTLSRLTTRARRRDSTSEESATTTSATIYGDDGPGTNALSVSGDWSGGGSTTDFPVSLALWQIGPSTADQRAAFYENPWSAVRPRALRIYSLPGPSVGLAPAQAPVNGRTSSGTSIALTFASAPAQDSLVIIVAGAWVSGGHTPTADDIRNGAASAGFTLAGSIAAPVGNNKVTVWWKKAGASEPSTYTYDPQNTGALYASACALNWTGQDLDSPIDRFFTVNGTSSTPSITDSTPTSTARQLVIAAMAADESQLNIGIDVPATPGYTNAHVEQNANDYNGLSVDHKIVSTIGTQSAAWGTLVMSSKFSAILLTIKEAASSPPPSGPTLSLPGVNSITATSATPKVTLTF
jgi:hypothetical protein